VIEATVPMPPQDSEDKPTGADETRLDRAMVRPLRVCFVIDDLDVGGTETQLLMLIQHLHRRKVEPYLCVLGGMGSRSLTLEPKDCPVLRLGLRSLCRPSIMAKAWRFARFLRRHRIDIVQTYFADSTYFAVPVARLAGVRRIILTRRNIGHWMKPVDRLMVRLCQRLAHATIANCEACRRAVIEQELARPERVHVIPNGIDLDRFAHIEPYQPAMSGRPRRVGMVGNLRPVKGVDVFIRAAAQVAAQAPNVTFHVAGCGDPEPYRQLAKQCGVADRVEFLGSVADVPAFLATLDVAVLPSRAEGLSNALLEYMAAGRPIVATAVGGNVELLRDGSTGVLVPPDDPEVLATALVGLAKARQRPRKLAAAARCAVRQYAEQAVVEDYERFLRRII